MDNNEKGKKIADFIARTKEGEYTDCQPPILVDVSYLRVEPADNVVCEEKNFYLYGLTC